MLLAPKKRPDHVWQAMKTALTQNLLFNQARGEAATGLAIMQQSGEVYIEKASIPADNFVNTPAYTNLLQQIGAQTTLLLGHTRNPTKGSPVNDHNNHPIEIGPVFGVHNGHIDNDDQLFQSLNLPRQAEVDSEIIFRLLEPYSPQQLDGSYLVALQPNLSCMQGQFTFLAADRRAADKLLVVKHQNPLSIYYHPQWAALIFSSSYIFLRKMFGPVVIHQTLPCDQLMHFKATQLERLQHNPISIHPLFAKPCPNMGETVSEVDEHTSLYDEDTILIN
ncbi:MAG: hypothetical protein KDI79_08925 [Anaerolineae bacterium]|nr:hypothetical protein [Anaerolineae bacterium]